MKRFGLFFAVLMLVFSMGGRARSAETHWLVGVWVGDLVGFSGKGGPTKTFNVLEVSADGRAEAAWANGLSTKTRSTKARVEGDKVSVVTSTNSRIELQLVGDELQGTFALADGKPFAISMKRVGHSIYASEEAERACKEHIPSRHFDGEFYSATTGRHPVEDTFTYEIIMGSVNVIDGQCTASALRLFHVREAPRRSSADVVVDEMGNVHFLSGDGVTTTTGKKNEGIRAHLSKRPRS